MTQKEVKKSGVMPFLADNPQPSAIIQLLVSRDFDVRYFSITVMPSAPEPDFLFKTQNLQNAFRV